MKSWDGYKREKFKRHFHGEGGMPLESVIKGHNYRCQLSRFLTTDQILVLSGCLSDQIIEARKKVMRESRGCRYLKNCKINIG